jgi:hypothetical protein
MMDDGKLTGRLVVHGTWLIASRLFRSLDLVDFLAE